MQYDANSVLNTCTSFMLPNAYVHRQWGLKNTNRIPWQNCLLKMKAYIIFWEPAFLPSFFPSFFPPSLPSFLFLIFLYRSVLSLLIKNWAKSIDSLRSSILVFKNSSAQILEYHIKIVHLWMAVIAQVCHLIDELSVSLPFLTTLSPAFVFCCLSLSLWFLYWVV